MTLAACTNNSKSNIFEKNWDTPYGTAPFDKISTADFLPAMRQGIADEKAEIQAIIDNQEDPTFENTIAAYSRAGSLLS